MSIKHPQQPTVPFRLGCKINRRIIMHQRWWITADEMSLLSKWCTDYFP